MNDIDIITQQITKIEQQLEQTNDTLLILKHKIEVIKNNVKKIQQD